MMDDLKQQVWIMRHGETEWSKAGRHTGRTDLPLTDAGRASAQALAQSLGGREFALVLVSPLGRAQETCRLAGYGTVAQVTADLREWDYGDYEGRTTADIRKERAGWYLWDNGVPNGETVEQVGARVQRVIGEILTMRGDVALFAHGHVLRILTACWLKLNAGSGKLYALDTGKISILGYEHETRVIKKWNC
jgi:broad specificity phosphatase PhoE